MAYSLFIDDERDPSDANWAPWYGKIDEWMIARNWQEVEQLINTLGMPDFISFDHDLGDPATVTHNGFQIAQEITTNVMDEVWDIPAGFGFAVHSKNPIGAANINGLLKPFLRHYGKE